MFRWAGSFVLFSVGYATGLEIERAEVDRMSRLEFLRNWCNTDIDGTNKSQNSPSYSCLLLNKRPQKLSLARFRDKSALFAGTKPPGDTEVTWGRPKGEPFCFSFSNITCIAVNFTFADHKPWW